MFYNTIRSTSRETMRRDNLSLSTTGSKSVNPREKLINVQKREKLKGLLVTKFMKKYGIKNPERLLQDEISKFLEGEKLTDADLKRLDDKLRQLLSEKEANENLRRNLTETSQNAAGLSNKDVVLPDLHKAETMSQHSKHSRMSGASHLTKYNEVHKSEIDDFDSLSMSSSKKPLHRFDFANDGDEWNAICLFNQKKFEEEKKLNRMKDMEIKKRTKDDLDNQIRQKLKRLNEEQLKNLEYDQILLDHTDYINDMERNKQMEMKAKVFKEKENRDKQMKDEKVRKRTEVVKEKKYEKELVKHLLEEIDKEKQKTIKKKIVERDILQKTLQDNELNKIKLIEQVKKERDDDVRCTKEYAKILEKQDNDRKEYFNKIERNSNNFKSMMVATILKDMELKNKDDEERMINYLNEKERRDQEDDEKKKIYSWGNKKMMKSYLDMQVEEKKKMTEFERTLNSEQARIWRTDTQRFVEQEKDIHDQIRMSNTLNTDYLKSQIELKKSKHQMKMNNNEYALNKNVLETIKDSN